MKYGTLLEVLRGNTKLAVGYFKQALAQWNGHGFAEHHSPDKNDYHVRNLCFALICDKALGSLSPLTSAQKTAMQNILWNICWDNTTTGGTGGIWTDYTWDGTSYRIPKVAKLTNEIAPLALLTDQTFIWSGFSYTP